MRFSVLSSGSKANCTFVESGDTRILIDCGLSGTQTEKRLLSLGIDPASIDAILVTHEHSDHIHGIATYCRRYKIPALANEGAAPFISRGGFGIEKFITGEAFSLGSLKIVPFSIAHDATDPVGFVIFAEGLKFAQATDLGRSTPLVRDAMMNCNSIVLESNHDPEMLQCCGYPWELKQRIASSHGHLSNAEAGELLNEVMHPELQHVVLGHLSENSNTPDMAYATVSQHIQAHPCQLLHNLICGSIAGPTPLFEVGASPIKTLSLSAA